MLSSVCHVHAVAGVRQDEILGLMRLGTAWVLDSDEPRTRMYMMAWALTHFIVKVTTGQTDTHCLLTLLGILPTHYTCTGTLSPRPHTCPATVCHEFVCVLAVDS